MDFAALLFLHPTYPLTPLSHSLPFAISVRVSSLLAPCTLYTEKLVYQNTWREWKLFSFKDLFGRLSSTTEPFDAIPLRIKLYFIYRDTAQGTRIIRITTIVRHNFIYLFYLKKLRSLINQKYFFSFLKFFILEFNKIWNRIKGISLLFLGTKVHQQLRPVVVSIWPCSTDNNFISSPTILLK